MNTEIFYDNGKSNLGPVYRANVDRLQEFRDGSKRLTRWAECLVFRLQSETTFDTTCVRAKYVLDGMDNE